MQTLIQPQQALEHIGQHLKPFPIIECPIDKCAGRILREDILADRPLPPFNRAMMDGYAIRVADLPKVAAFRIVAQAPAGTPALAMGRSAGNCIEIMTGAVVPQGADCVIPYEATERLKDGSVRIHSPEGFRAGDAIHPEGSDHSSGEALIRTGRMLGGREIAVAATCGYASLKVSKLPSITIVSTGDELVDVAATPDAHQIRRSNDLSIETTLNRAGYPAQKRVHLADEAASTFADLSKLIANNDILIISGGISMGKKDFIPGALTDNGLNCHFHGIAQKPGKPLGFWSGPGCAVFALPGNPLSTLTCLHQYVLSALNQASGNIPRQHSTVTLTEPVKGRANLTVFLPVSLEANNQVVPRPTNNSGDLVNILQSDGYIVLPPNAESFEPGSEFTFYPWI